MLKPLREQQEQQLLTPEQAGELIKKSR